jgi:hypothetical protein
MWFLGPPPPDPRSVPERQPERLADDDRFYERMMAELRARGVVVTLAVA